MKVNASQNALDLATIKSFGNLEFYAKQVVEGFITGLHQSPYHGFSVEFAEHKQYNTGQSIRHIDWKLFHKTDKLFVKSFDEETNLRCYLLLDISSSMYYPAANHGKLTFALVAAASLTYLLQKQKDAVGICTFADEIIFQSPIKSSSSHVHQLFQVFEQLLNAKSVGNTTSSAKVIHQIAEKIHNRSLVIIFSDMFETHADPTELYKALQHLKHRKHEVLIFQMKDQKTEQLFEFENKPYYFTDIETGEKVKLNPMVMRQEYQEKMEARQKELKLVCGQLKIAFLEIDIAQDLKELLQIFLQKRSKMV
jgi:uncharacterized protein (DUF58 family)